MKTTNYYCLKCSTTMKFQIRDIGRMPQVIGCKKKGCDGRSTEVPSFQATMDEVDGIFFRPQTKNEWDGIKHQLKYEIKEKHKGISNTKMNKILKEVMVNLNDYVSGGGLIQLPISYFSKIKKQSVH